MRKHRISIGPPYPWAPVITRSTGTKAVEGRPPAYEGKRYLYRPDRGVCMEQAGAERRGIYLLTFFDSFLDVAEEEGMKVIFGTPTATPPVWLTEKYPEVLNCRLDGTPFRHGMRRHYNYNSSVYRKFCSIIVEKAAQHYGQRPCIVGWQIDNEINCEVDVFYSESDTAAFREFLKEKYQTLDALNEAWGTVFWNQTYTKWEEIYVPRPTVHDSTNPHQVLDYTRFVSASAIQFCKIQSDIIRKI